MNDRRRHWFSMRNGINFVAKRGENEKRGLGLLLGCSQGFISLGGVDSLDCRDEPPYKYRSNNNPYKQGQTSVWAVSNGQDCRRQAFAPSLSCWSRRARWAPPLAGPVGFYFPSFFFPIARGLALPHSRSSACCAPLSRRLVSCRYGLCDESSSGSQKSICLYDLSSSPRILLFTTCSFNKAWIHYPANINILPCPRLPVTHRSSIFQIKFSKHEHTRGVSTFQHTQQKCQVSFTPKCT